MGSLLLVLGVITPLLFESGLAGYPAPVSCASQECVSYEVIQSQKEFEIRKYSQDNWVTGPVITASSYNDAVRQGYPLLFSYTQGNNIPKTTLKMTAPVLVDIQRNPNFRVYLKLPKNAPFPAPLPNQNINEVSLPVLSFGAVRRFGGIINDATIASETAELKKQLQGTPWGSKLKDPLLSVADYNRGLIQGPASVAPMQTQDSVNEIILWFRNP